MNYPLVSIIIPCFNDAEFIEQSVNSALGQNYPNKEVVIVDDGSNPNTKKILEELKPLINILITQDNQGLSSARNKGISRASGEFVLVLDSDDFFDEEFCSKAVDVMLTDPEVRLVSCQAILFNEFKEKSLYKPEGGVLQDFLFSNAAIGNSLFRKKDWLETGGYDETMKRGYEDWEFFIRLLKMGGRAHIIQEPLFYYRQKKQSLRHSANRIKYDLWKYIFLKHREIYIKHYDSLIDFLVGRIEFEEKEKIKNSERLEFQLGFKFLYPFRVIKKII